MAREKFVKCKSHPQYLGKREPKASCIACWRYYVDMLHKEFNQKEYEDYYRSLRQNYIK